MTDSATDDNAVFNIPVRIYWEDTDAGGIVYHANYLRYMERARSDWLRAIGIDQNVMQMELGCNFVVVSSMINFRQPAKLNDDLTVTASVTEASKASFWFDQTVSRDGQLLVDAKVRAACINANTYRPMRVPNDIYDLLLTAKVG